MARHLVATGQLIDEDPAEALAHALAARRLASRISAVREAVGLAAYHAGEWQTAIAELRTYHRMSGLQSHLAVLADCERALGRPERAIDLFRGADQDKLDQAVAIELLIVAAGARGDLGQKDAAVAMLQVPDLTSEATVPWTARLRYAYADALLAVGRREEAREWFSRAADVDTEGETDAAERLLELDGVVIEGDDEDEAEEIAAGPGTPGAVPTQPDTDLAADADDIADGDDRDEDDDRDDEADEDFDDEDDDRDEDFDDDEEGGAVARSEDVEDVDVEDEDRHPDQSGNAEPSDATAPVADGTAPTRGDESEPTQR
ncbi:Replicase polyprotein 1ab [Micromonospora sp. WMMD710]|uniref:Replicase polyprotein 1ab n=1 Tax=Micromonospora sp. WMMD710 TaxID=3016085 RepID=UPI00241755C8|nr:Replicase polyprotein 1ab [Micromonospora sp. WMMD710]MDG4758625.1 Replicase polyprotein 1ab [Micromonospora sp. WMMD710]